MKWPQMSLDATKWHVKFQILFGGTPPNPPTRGGTPPLVLSPPARLWRASWPLASLVSALFSTWGKTLCFLKLNYETWRNVLMHWPVLSPELQTVRWGYLGPMVAYHSTGRQYAWFIQLLRSPVFQLYIVVSMVLYVGALTSSLWSPMLGHLLLLCGLLHFMNSQTCSVLGPPYVFTIAYYTADLQYLLHHPGSLQLATYCIADLQYVGATLALNVLTGLHYVLQVAGLVEFQQSVEAGRLWTHIPRPTVIVLATRRQTCRQHSMLVVSITLAGKQRMHLLPLNKPRHLYNVPTPQCHWQWKKDFTEGWSLLRGIK